MSFDLAFPELATLSLIGFPIRLLMLKVRCSTTELRAHMVVFRTSEYFHAWLLYTPPITLLSTPILLCYWETSWGLSLTSSLQFTTWSWWRESNPHFQIGSLKFYHSLNYTCIREVVLMSFPSHGAHGRTRTDTVSLPRDFLTTLCRHSQSYDCCSLDSIFTICFRT